MQNQYNDSIANLRESVFAEDGHNLVHKKFLECVGETEPSGRILDIGTGNGYILREIKKRYPDKYKLIGVDSSSDMLKKARVADSHIEWILADNNNLSFESDYFSTITAKNVTRFSASELARVLQSEGLFVFREYAGGKGLVEIAQLFPNRLIRSRKPDYYADQLSNAGFENIDIHQYPFEKEYGKDELLRVVQMFPFIEDLSNVDLEAIKSLFKNRGKITITSDPFILIAKRKAR